MSAIDNVRKALAMRDADYHCYPSPEDVATVLRLYDAAQKALRATQSAFDDLPMGHPLQVLGSPIDHTKLNEARRLIEEVLK